MKEVSVLRCSVLGETWSIVAPRRSRRPRQSFDQARRKCHFCQGNERQTEPEVFALRPDSSLADSPGWKLRVVPNKYPALEIQPDEVPTIAGPYRQVAARGFHEVIIETPDHHRSLRSVAAGELATLLGVYRSRLIALSAHPRVRSVALFRNEGVAAGASQQHPHTQVLALPIVSSRVAREIFRAKQHFRCRACCITCEILEREYLDSHRLIDQNAHFAALTAFAPRFPYETWIVPKGHAHDFAAASPRELSSLASLLNRVLCALESTLGTFPFNLIVQTAPVRVGVSIRNAYHWRIEIVPRVTTASGFELGTGIFIVATSPEQAARTLRSALPASHQPDADGTTSLASCNASTRPA